jgi:hypothetical protein
MYLFNIFHNQKILREEDTDIQKNVRNLLKTKGIDFAASVVGGFKNVVKILNLDVTNIDTQEMLVKNFIYFFNLDGIEVSFIEVRTTTGGKVLDVHLKTDDPAANIETWYVRTICDYLNNELFTFKITPSYYPVFKSGNNLKIYLKATKINDEEKIQENLEDYISKKIVKRMLRDK